MKLSDKLLRFALHYRVFRPFYRLSTRLVGRYILAGASVLAIVFLILLLLLRGSLAHYLHDVDSPAIYQLSISVGAALVGLVGVVFTLTLFVIQQISSASIPGLLREYASDKATQWIYVVLGCLALLALSSALIVPARHPSAPILLVTFAVLGTFVLLWCLFDRVVTLADPSNVIEHVRKRALEELESLEHLRVVLLEQSPELAKARLSINEDANAIPTALAALRHYNPGLTAKMERSLRQLYALSRQFAAEHNQDLFREAITATTDVLVQYVDYHGRNIPMGNSVTYMMGLDASQDRILSNALDVYSTVARESATIKDTEMSKATLRGLSAIAIKSVDRAPLLTAQGENATTGLILGTMVEAVQNFISTSHIEGTFASFAPLLAVTIKLSQEGYYQTARFALTKLSELSQLCLAAEQPILATEGTATLLGALSYSLAMPEKTVDLEGASVKELFAVCRMQLQLAPKGTHFRSFDVGRSHPISRTFGVGDDTVVGIHQKTTENAIAALESRDEREWLRLSRFLSEFHEKLPQRLADLGALSADKDQMILFWIESAAFAMAQQMLRLWYHLNKATKADGAAEQAETGEEGMNRYRRVAYMNRLSNELRLFMVRFYSRSRGFQEKGIFADRVIDCYESVVSISSDATSLGATQVAVGAAEMLVHSATSALKEHGYVAVRPVCQFVGRLLETAAIARVTANAEVEAAALSTVKTTFQRCVEITLLEQEMHEGFALDDPERLLLNNLREYADQERHLLLEEKSRTFAKIVSTQTAANYEAEMVAKFQEWAGELLLPPTNGVQS